MNWKIELNKLLSNNEKLRVFNRSQLIEVMENNNLKVPLRTLLRQIQVLEESNIIQRIYSGIYINKIQQNPIVQNQEVLNVLRPNAILSLNYVLGNSGVLNNPTFFFTAVLPTSSNKSQNEIKLDDGNYINLAYLNDDFFNEDILKISLQKYSKVPMATPEKAIIDLLYLNSSARGNKRWSLPPLQDWDISSLNMDKLNLIAEKLNMTEQVNNFINEIENEKTRASKPKIRIK